MIRVTVWNEFFHEKTEKAVQKIYPEGIHMEIAAFLRTDEEVSVRTATLSDPGSGLSDEILNETDVLIWWGHCRHKEVPNDAALRVTSRVLAGMGFIALHSSHESKPFTMLMGTSCSLRWHEYAEKERIFIIEPAHPICKNLPAWFELEHEEMYGERFDIPAPDELVMLSWFKTGEVFRSGCCYVRGCGKIFYFRPGHEAYPTYKNEYIQQIIRNAIRWSAPPAGLHVRSGSLFAPPLESL